LAQVNQFFIKSLNSFSCWGGILVYNFTYKREVCTHLLNGDYEFTVFIEGRGKDWCRSTSYSLNPLMLFMFEEVYFSLLFSDKARGHIHLLNEKLGMSSILTKEMGERITCRSVFLIKSIDYF